MTHMPEPSLRDVVGWAWAARLWIAGGLVTGVLVALIWMMLSVPQYRITMLVGPTTRTGTPDISALFPENASFALEYVLRSFGPGDSSDFMRFETILRGPTVSAALLQDEALRSGVNGERRWAFQGQRDIEDASALSSYLNKKVRIEPVGNTPMRRITYHHADPQFGRQLLLGMYGQTDRLIRDEIRAKTDARIEWLKKALFASSDPEHRRMLTTLLMEQEQVRMILALDEPFSAVLAEPPAVSAKPVWPDKSLLFVVFSLMGAAAGFLVGHSAGARRFPVYRSSIAT